jgi:hypothetical protein
MAEAYGFGDRIHGARREHHASSGVRSNGTAVNVTTVTGFVAAAATASTSASCPSEKVMLTASRFSFSVCSKNLMLTASRFFL